MGLLDTLTEQSDCLYLSDLNAERITRYLPFGLLEALKSMNAGRWPCDEWKEAVYYMTGLSPALDSADAYRRFLVEKLEVYDLSGSAL